MGRWDEPPMVQYAVDRTAIATARRARRHGDLRTPIVIVVAILHSFLLLAAAPFFLGLWQLGSVCVYTKNSEVQSMIGPAGPLSQQIEWFAFYHKRYPATLDELLDPPDLAGTGDTSPETYVRDPSSLCDPWGRRIRYRVPGNRRLGSFDLWSAGPDGVDSTPDDIVNWAAGR